MHDSTPTLRLARFPQDRERLAHLNIEYLLWATQRLWEEFEVVFPVPDLAESEATVGKFGEPGALFLVLEQGDDLVGMAGLRTLEPGITEVKRMYVQPHLQGRRLGSALLDQVLEQSRGTLQAHTVRLDSCSFMLDAQRLYESRGFKPRDAYPGSEIPEQLQHHWRFFELDLEAVDKTF